MDFKIRINSASVDATEDSYEEGELDFANSWSIDSLRNKTFNNVDELVAAVHDAEWVFSADKSDYGYIDGRIDSDATVTDKYEIPTEDEYEAWKRGELMLYNAHLMIYVTMVPAGMDHKMTEDEARSFGLEIY